MTLAQRLIEHINRPDPRPYAFDVGQRVRVLKGVVNDGQTPACWAGAIVTIVSRHASMMQKDHLYRVRHGCGLEDRFRETELDRRYARSASTAGEGGKQA